MCISPPIAAISSRNVLTFMSGRRTSFEWPGCCIHDVHEFLLADTQPSRNCSRLTISRQFEYAPRSPRDVQRSALLEIGKRAMSAHFINPSSFNSCKYTS
jgi:hypothetical protein